MRRVSFVEYLRLQMEEALGPVNRWYAGEHGVHDDPESLLRYYIENGGAEDFARRYRVEDTKENESAS